jgi:hypothetical protein
MVRFGPTDLRKVMALGAVLKIPVAMSLTTSLDV